MDNFELKKYLIDANAVCILWASNPNSVTEYYQPKPFIIHSDLIIYSCEGISVVWEDEYDKKKLIGLYQYVEYKVDGIKIYYIDEDKINIKKLYVYLTQIGNYQEYGYKYIIDNLRSKKSVQKKGFKELQDNKTYECVNFKNGADIALSYFNDSVEGYIVGDKYYLSA